MKNKDIKEIISGENGRLSSKRVMGIIIISICLMCTCWLVWNEGGTQVVENLLQTLMIMAAALLGISSVTSIFKKNIKTTNNVEEIEEIKSDEQFIEDYTNDPCSTCKYNKKGEA